MVVVGREHGIGFGLVVQFLACLNLSDLCFNISKQMNVSRAVGEQVCSFAFLSAVLFFFFFVNVHSGAW